ncbi:MAG TPA: hypothetical protein VIF62_20045 [Labilithrix sp.]
MIRSLLLSAVALSLVACASDPKPPPKTSSGDEVPANSAAEAHLQGATAKPTDPSQPPPPPPSDPSKPVMTPVAPSSSSGNATDKVSKTECETAQNHALDVAIASDPRFQGIPPDVLATLKSQAMGQLVQQKPGENPCTNGKGITRAEYDCEMAATTLDEYKKCEPKDTTAAKPGAKKKK